MKVERRLYRLRFLNAANARAFTLALGNGRKMIQIGSDGGLLPKPVGARRSRSSRPSASTWSSTSAQFGVGSKVILHNTVGEATTQAVMRFDVVRGGAEEARVPKVLAEESRCRWSTRERAWPLTFQGLGSVDVADRRRRLRRDADRLPPAPGLDRAVDVDEQLRSARTRCTCTATTSASSR